MDGFLIYHTSDVDPQKLRRWGQRLCSELCLATRDGKKTILGLWEAPTTGTAAHVVRNRLQGNLRSWCAGTVELIELLDAEGYRAALATTENRVDVLTLPPPQKKARSTVSTAFAQSVDNPPAASDPGSSSSPPFIFDPSQKLLALGGSPVRAVADAAGNAWFQAKPMIVFLEYANITTTLERLDPEDVKSLETLLPQIFQSNTQNTGYNDLKALYINEPGLYDLILGSQKREARVFKRWVTHEVLPALRRSSETPREDDGQQLALREDQRAQELQLALRDHTQAVREEMLTMRKEVQTLQQSFTSAFGAWSSGLKLSLCTHLNDVICSPTGRFVKALRAATKPLARKSTADSINFPETQQATSFEVSLLSATLAETLVAEIPSLTYPAWKAVRGLIGKRAKKLRVLWAATKPQGDPLCAAKPLLWAFVGGKRAEGGGARYVYLKPHATALVRDVLAQTAPDLPERAAESIRDRVFHLSSTLPAEEWPVVASELEPVFDHE
jgi:prophage antirepressor-like protein